MFSASKYIEDDVKIGIFRKLIFEILSIFLTLVHGGYLLLFGHFGPKTVHLALIAGFREKWPVLGSFGAKKTRNCYIFDFST